MNPEGSRITATRSCPKCRKLVLNPGFVSGFWKPVHTSVVSTMTKNDQLWPDTLATKERAHVLVGCFLKMPQLLVIYHLRGDLWQGAYYILNNVMRRLYAVPVNAPLLRRNNREPPPPIQVQIKFHRLLAIKRLMRSVTAEGRSAALCKNNLHKHDLLTANLTSFPSFCRNTRSSRCMKPNM
jgi:hypothetical protein